MGLFSRLALLFRIRTRAALEKAEEPGAVLDYAYTKQVEQVQQLRRAIADVATNRKQLELQQTQLLNNVDKLTSQAGQALRLGREDLARQALQRKELFVPQLHNYERQIAQLREQEERLLQMEQDVATRIEIFRTQKEMAKVQYHAAQTQVKLRESLGGISGEMGEIHIAMQRAQEKILTMQARANALEELLEQGVIGEQRSLGAGDALGRELQRIDMQQNVELQLQAMKEQLQLGGRYTQPKQIEGPTSFPE